MNLLGRGCFSFSFAHPDGADTVIVVIILLSGVCNNNEWGCSRSSLMICKRSATVDPAVLPAVLLAEGRSDIRSKKF